MRFTSSLAAILCLAGCLNLADRDNPLDDQYTGPRGALKGKVVLRSGTAIQIDEETGKAAVNYSGVGVALDRLPQFVTTTTGNGEFSIGRIPVGTWKFTLSAPGYITQSVSVAIRKNEVTELPVLNIDEVIAGKLVFGSSRSGFPSLFETDAAGRGFKSLSSLPIQSNYCRYADFLGRPVLVIQSDFIVYEEAGEYKSDAGFIVSQYPSLTPVVFLPAGSEVQRPALQPNGKLIFGLDAGGDNFLAEIRPRDVRQDANPEEYRLTGSPDDKWKESSPAVSPSGKIAYIRLGQEPGSSTPAYEIRVLDGSAGPGKLVHRRSLDEVALELAKQNKFDFDRDGNDDLVKLISVVFSKPNQLTLTPGIDWSAPIDYGNVSAYLEGAQPDGIVLDAYQIVVELLQLGAIWDLSWLPDDQTLVFADRLFSNPGLHIRQLWPIHKNASYVQDSTGAVVKEPTNGRATYYYTDIDLNGSYSAAVDKPFWYESPASYIEAFDVTMKRIEIQTLRKVGVTRTHQLAEATPFFFSDPNQWIFSPAVSPDGKRIAIALGPTESLLDNYDVAPMMTEGDIVTVDPANGFVTRITTDGYNNRAPCWVP